MTQDHEYSVIGHSRAVVGRYLGTIAAAVASITVLLLGGVLGIADWLGIELPQVILWPLTAVAIFPFVHWIFNRFVWKWARVVSWLKIPDLNGEWNCQARTLNMDKAVLHEWSGTVTITQTWEKIWVNLRTPQSNSYSEAAALIREPDGCFRLMYRYKNEPKMGEPELATHVGFAELRFAKGLKSAEGDYFNSKGRYTFGTINLRRRRNGHGQAVRQAIS